jgi:hypothetical protein
MPARRRRAQGSILGHACTLTVYNFVGGGAQNSSCIAVSIDGGAFVGHGREDNAASRTQTDIMIGNSGGAGGTGQFLIDDVMWAWNDSAVPTLPTNKGIFPVAITSHLTAQTGFTGTSAMCRAYPKAPTSALPPYYPSALQSTSADSIRDVPAPESLHARPRGGRSDQAGHLRASRVGWDGHVRIKVNGSTIKSVASGVDPANEHRRRVAAYRLRLHGMDAERL